MEQCVGLIVGQPPRAYFAIGSQPPLLLCLDPHTVSAYTPLRDDEQLDAYHCREPVAIHVGTLAPSVLAGFYCPDKSSFHRLCERFEMFAQTRDPIVTVVDENPWGDGTDDDSELSMCLLESLRLADDPLLQSTMAQ
eukprot:TRINITY_DN6828_c0_g1_i1.p2 TRINITY_DN6828_c0_g1~~TRINITY_DN6828_c0_g1_i1.p2  ORF type:complete len:137 (-),score=32.37 TRINITY_DN6828_c0_g1_i1:45-455(-)